MKQLIWMEMHRFKRFFFYGLFLIIVLFELCYILGNLSSYSVRGSDI